MSTSTDVRANLTRPWVPPLPPIDDEDEGDHLPERPSWWQEWGQPILVAAILITLAMMVTIYAGEIAAVMP